MKQIRLSDIDEFFLNKDLKITEERTSLTFYVGVDMDSLGISRAIYNKIYYFFIIHSWAFYGVKEITYINKEHRLYEIMSDYFIQYKLER